MTRWMTTVAVLAFAANSWSAAPPDARTLARAGKIEEATRLNFRGVALYRAGRLSEATAVLADVLRKREELFPKARFPQGHADLANSLNNLAFMHKEQGEFAKAESLFRRALQMIETLYPKERYPQGHTALANSLNNLASLHQAREEFAKAEPLLRRALAIRESLFPEARFPHGHPDLAVSINSLAFMYEGLGDYSKSEPLYRRALEMREGLFPKERYPFGHPQLATTINNLAALYHSQGHSDKAEPLFRRALEMCEGLYPKERFPYGHPDLARSLTNLAALYQARREYAKAEMLSKRALLMHQQQSARLALSAPEALALNYAATLPLTHDGLLSVTRHLKDKSASTYGMIWQSKAHLTRVYERRHLSLLAGLSSPKVKSLWRQLVDLRRQRERLLLAPLTANLKVRDERLKQIEESIANLEEELRPLLPAVPRAEKLARAKPEELQKALPAGAVFLDLRRYTFFDQDPRTPGAKGEKRTVSYVAFVVSKERIRRVELGPVKLIDEAVADWRQAITSWRPGRPEASRQAAKVRDLLWGKIEGHLPASTTTVYLSPDGDLSRVPWAALPGKKSGSILLEDCTLAVVPHGIFLLDRLTAPATTEKGKAILLALGGARYDLEPRKEVDTRAIGKKVVGGDKLSWDFLKGTEQELKQVGKIAAGLDVHSISGTKANRDAVLSALPRARYAHLATHGFFANKEFRSILQLDEKLFARHEFVETIGERIGVGAQNPLVLSGLVLAGANLPETPDRGILSADAIVSLPLDKLELAVLSACETGLGDVAGGEGVFGLQRAFHMAGTRNVVASLWKVNDSATTALMVLFYRNLWQEKLPPIQALRRAQLSLYYHPESVKDWAEGKRGPNLKKTFKGSAVVPPPVTVKGRAPSHWWAAFVLSGPGN